MTREMRLFPLTREGRTWAAGHPPGARTGPQPALFPGSTSLEALKSLLSTTGHWQDFAHLELPGTWALFTTIHTYPLAVGLLAR